MWKIWEEIVIENIIMNGKKMEERAEYSEEKIQEERERFRGVEITLPQWLIAFYEANYDRKFKDIHARMELAIELSALNVKYGTGGPFGAAIFHRDSHKLISVGVNRVVPENFSIAHAEIMAILMAEKTLKTYDLGAEQEVELVTSSQPCIQCFGALIWAGIHKVVIGANGEDVKKITGFDEGPLPHNWEEELKLRGIEVIKDLMRGEACSVLENYAEQKGIIYNSSVQINQKKQ